MSKLHGSQCFLFETFRYNRNHNPYLGAIEQVPLHNFNEIIAKHTVRKYFGHNLVRNTILKWIKSVQDLETVENRALTRILQMYN